MTAGFFFFSAARTLLIAFTSHGATGRPLATSSWRTMGRSSIFSLYIYILYNWGIFILSTPGFWSWEKAHLTGALRRIAALYSL